MKNACPHLRRRPSRVSPYAEACLQALVSHGFGETISLGGAFGLLHYLDYRSTNHIDAWWVGSPTSEDMKEVVGVIEDALRRFGRVATRAWGDVISIELTCEGKAVFSFQIARRAAQLEAPKPAPWTQVLLDSLSDLLASKMVALVERGAPRDFRDVYAVCQAGLSSPARAWALWRRRQRLAGDDTDSQRAKVAVETHLARIAAHRPLNKITDPQQRAEAEKLRIWFVKEFLRALE